MEEFQLLCNPQKAHKSKWLFITNSYCGGTTFMLYSCEMLEACNLTWRGNILLLGAVFLLCYCSSWCWVLFTWLLCSGSDGILQEEGMLTIPRICGAVTELLDRSATSWAAHRELAGGRGCPPAWASRWGVSRCHADSQVRVVDHIYHILFLFLFLFKFFFFFLFKQLLLLICLQIKHGIYFQK